ncbi:ATP-grasp domain-containing protein [Salinicoccus sp. YB14-2]|uniref:ATP-grasp domain-containing protein n=1 Tax=Salinicoccus sp. YB14-2 TaxID=1572701 RepID=UPI000691EA42|nr:ATP-grasp domain-containing protein [Salinicoccus sp. YB14-2]
MNSKDLEYIYNNIPYENMNLYDEIKFSSTTGQYIDKASKLGFNYSVEKLNTGFKQLNLKRKDGSLIDILKSPIYPGNSLEGRRISISKMEAERLLTLANIETTRSKVYSGHEMELARDEAFKNSDKTVVIKPNNMSLGRGVHVNINSDNFEKFWNMTRNVMIKHGRKKKQDILVQNYLKGFEARATIIEGKFNSIVARVPAFVMGDGQNSIQDLINIKNKERQKCAHLKKKLIKMDESIKSFLSSTGKTLETIPHKNEYVLLISVSNTSLGGEMVDITNLVCNEIKEIAINALAALPDMCSGGVDIMMESFDDRNPAVIEINAFPLLQSTIYPTYGPSTDPQSYFLNSFYVRDQFLTNPESRYDIENEMDYLYNFFSYQEKQKFYRDLIYKNSKKLKRNK